MSKGGWDSYYCHPNLQTEARNPFTLLTTHSNQSLGKLSGHILLPSAHATTQVWHHTPPHSLPHHLTSTHSTLFHLCSSQLPRGNEREETQDKTQTLYQALTLAHPSASLYRTPATLATLLTLHTPNSLLPQHLCTCCSFCQEGSSPKSFTGLARLCHSSLS